MSSVSQSVARSIALFELFAERQSGLTAAEITAHLEAPRSSTAALLKELSDLSLLSLNRRTLTYLPTMRFAQLGNWLSDAAHFPVALTDAMERLQAECQETVTVSWPIDHEMEIIRVERSRQPISFVAERGQRLPLWTSAVGAAYLSSLSNAQVRARWERDRRQMSGLPPIEAKLEHLAAVRTVGVSVVHGGVFADASALAALVDLELDGRPLVLSIAGPRARLTARQAELQDVLIAACKSLVRG